jgi:dihydropteroate synthase
MHNEPFRIGSRTFSFAERPAIMGILNVTPDSFSDGGKFLAVDAALAHAGLMIEEGADIIDVGGESTRPGAPEVGEAEEIARVIPVISEIVRRYPGVPISIDTMKSAVARAALGAGATMVNDVSGLAHDPALAREAAAGDAALVVMHMRGTPRTMQRNPVYVDVVRDVHTVLAAAIAAARAAGVVRVVVDPGIGFGKSLEHNLELIRSIDRFADLGAPVLIGVSRKSFLGALLGGAPAERRLHGTAAAVALAVARGADILRVHDVAAMRDAAIVARAIG